MRFVWFVVARYGFTGAYPSVLNGGVWNVDPTGANFCCTEVRLPILTQLRQKRLALIPLDLLFGYNNRVKLVIGLTR